MSNSKPISCTPAMARAFLDGRKTQTRRLSGLRDFNARPESWTCDPVAYDFYPEKVDRRGHAYPGDLMHGVVFEHVESPVMHAVRSPYGAPGDTLWVREAWATLSCHDGIPPRDVQPDQPIWYATSNAKPALYGRKRPAMFMPQWASRMTLVVDSVRCERLQDITEEDAVQEGVRDVETFSRLWRTINGPSSWDDNPWVWVVDIREIRITTGVLPMKVVQDPLAATYLEV